MKKILLLVFLLILLTGCELIMPQNSSSRNVYLISVALNYGTATGIGSLTSTLNDQMGVEKELEYISDSCGYPFTSVLLTQNGYAYSVKVNGDSIKNEKFSRNTSIKDDILLYLRAFASKTDQNDLFIFHYSGHGMEETGELVLNTINDKGGIRRENLVMITPDEIYQSVKGNDGIKFLVIDSCYSGVFNDSLTPDNASYPFKDFLALPEKNENIFVLTGASSEEKSWENYGYGNMTRCFLQSLGFNTETGNVGIAYGKRYFSEVVSYVQKNVKNYMNGSKQHPEGASVKDFLIYSR